MKSLLKEILELTELIENNSINQKQAFLKLRELNFKISEKFGIGSFKYERLYYYILDANEIAKNLN